MIKRKLVLFFCNLIPTINRIKLIEIAKEKNAISIVENPYFFEIKKPNQKLAKLRFGELQGIKKVDCFFGLYLNDVRLIGPYGIPVTRKGQIILEPLSNKRKYLYFFLLETLKTLGVKGFLFEYFLAIFPFFDKKKNIFDEEEGGVGAHLFCRGARNTKNGLATVFGHWVTEQLPQLRGIEAISKKINKKFKLILNNNPASWQIDSLIMMGYEKSNIFQMKENGLRVKKLILASLRSFNSKNMEIDPKARKWAAKRMQFYIKNNLKQINHNENLCLFRQERKNRIIKNIDFVRKTAKKFFFFEINLLNYPNLFEVSKNFLHGKNFLATWGSGIANIMFMEEPKLLIEIFSPEEEKRSVYFFLASEFAMDYKCIPADLIINNTTNDKSAHNGNHFREWNVNEAFLSEEII
jgi:hypothetical protein